MTLGEMKTSLQALVNRRDFTADTSLQETFFNQAILDVQRSLRLPVMEKITDITVDSGYGDDGGIIIPTDLLELKSIIPVDGTDTVEELLRCEISEAKQLALTTGRPQKYCREGTVWVLGPAPAVDDVIRLVYYAELDALSTDATETDFSQVGWDLLVYGAAVKAGIHYRHPKTQDWASEYQRIATAMQDMADNDALNSNAVIQPTLHFPKEAGVDY